ncbi:MAG: DUF2853 family protein [Saprospiraceae bacterium]|nr:DUF2853 family protein [Saprospiraceae bacterium]
MSKFDEAIALYQQQMESLGISYDHDLLVAVTKGLGPSIYKTDASKVSCSDKAELERVKKNFLIGKMGMSDSPDLDIALHEVCHQMGSSNRNKYRAIFYYLLVEKLNHHSKYLN